ncbi:MAG: DUF2946 family protein [Stenotrophobium sp.]
MEDWVQRALAKWPNVPALFGWLGLDRRGRWLIRGEVISRPQIIDTINANYAADAQGRWFFQNGPQRGYMKLEYAPLILRTDGAGRLMTHTGHHVENPAAAFLDEHGALLIGTEHGPGVLADHDLDWALARLHSGGTAVDEDQLAAALSLPSGTASALHLYVGTARLPLLRLDSAHAPRRLGFVRDPQQLESEKAQTAPATPPP